MVYRPGKANIADALSRLNQANPKDPSSEKEDLVRFVAQESTPVALTPREIERKSKNDSELASVRQYIHTGEWSQCKMPGYVCVKNELCTIEKLAPNFKREPYTVLAKDRHQVTVKSSEGAVYRRNNSWLKPYISSDEIELDPEDTEIKDTDTKIKDTDTSNLKPVVSEKPVEF